MCRVSHHTVSLLFFIAEIENRSTRKIEIAQE